MKYTDHSKPAFIKRPLAIILLVVGVLLLTLLVLEKTNVINLYSTETPSATQQPVSTIDYSPPTGAEMPDESIKQQDSAGTAETTNQTPSGTIGVILSAAGQDYKGGPVVIRTILENANGGTCTVTLKKQSIVKTYSAEINWQGNYYSCAGFDVPYADLSPGAWELTISAAQGDNAGEASQDITVEAN